MKLLLLHQNFPGQFRQLTPHLLARGHELVGICSHQRPLPEMLGLRVLRYPEPPSMEGAWPHGTKLWHEALLRAEVVGRLLSQLESEGWRPDCVLAHCGWGEVLPVKRQWPAVPLLVWPELWLRPDHLGFGTDPLLGPVTTDASLANFGRNALTEASLAQASAWVLPTLHQANSLPASYQGERMHVIHEGIDTHLASPNPGVSYEVRGIRIDRSVPTITFVNRNLERLRGFDTFMRALPIIQRKCPAVRVLIVGDNEAGYGGADPSGLPLREVMLNELQGQLDLERIHFLGRIPHPNLISMMQASWVHVYLSYPFILGWSLLEAMSCGCCIVGSRGMPVEEVINDGVEGVLVPISDHQRLAHRVIALLTNSQLRLELGKAARLAALAWDQSVMLPKLTELIEGSR